MRTNTSRSQLACQIPEKEAAPSTITTLSSLAKNLDLHKPGLKRIGNTNPLHGKHNCF